MGIGGGAVLFFADDDGDGLAGGELETVAASSTCLRSAMVFSAQLPPLPPSWMPWCCLSCSLRTKFCCVCIFWAWSGWSSSSSQNLRVAVREGVRGTKKHMCSCQNLLDLRIQWILLVGGNLLNEQVQ